MTRPWTPDRTNEDGSRTISSKRACNGCGALLGDVSKLETTLAIAGQPLPDVRKECPACAPTAPEPACRPVRTVDGAPACLDQSEDCGHDIALDAEYCVKVTEHTICLTHSDIANDGAITRPEPWPCQRAKAVSRG